MSLEDLNNAVYKRDFVSQPQGRETASPASVSAVTDHEHPAPSVSVWSDTAGVPISAGASALLEKERRRIRRRTVLGIAFLVLTGLTIVGVLGKRFFLFDAADISLHVTGPELVKTGDVVTLTIEYQNNNWLGLTNSELTVSFPESFQPHESAGWNLSLSRATYKLPVIPGHAGGQVTLSGTLQAFEKKTAFFKATLVSSPSGISNPTETIGQWTMAVDASALKLEVAGPPSLVLGQPLEYEVTYRNGSGMTIENLQLLLTYPEGFVPTGFDPRPTREENRWSIGRLEAGSEGRVHIRGEMRGNAGDARRLLAQLGKERGDGGFLALAQEEKLTKVISPPLSVELDINGNVQGSVDPGQSLIGKVLFQNNSNVGIRDIIATVTIDELYLDMNEVTVPRGVSYNRSKHQLVFRASEVPELRSLEPNERGDFSFVLKVRSDIAALNKNNIEIRTQVVLDSPDLPHGQNTEVFMPKSERIVKVNSLVKPDIQVAYEDAQFPNVGPFPPRVGELTTYTVRLTIATEVNTINNARWVMSIPSSTQFRSSLAGDKNTLKYNERTGELMWNLGSIAPGQSGMREVVFQIGVTPSPGMLQNIANLIDKGTVIGRDSFTGKEIELMVSHVVVGHINE